MTEGEFGRVLGAVLLRAFDEIRAATDDKAPDATDVAGSARESPRPRFLEREIAELLADGVWRTAAEIAEKGKGGIRARRGDVEACLLSSRLFSSANGREIIGRDGKPRSPKATLYQLAESKATGAVLPPETAGTSPTSHNDRDGHGATRPDLGLVEHPPSSARLRTIELRVPTITLLIGSDER
jgi:hypothetical protein